MVGQQNIMDTLESLRFTFTRIYGRLRRPMRGLRRTARFARLPPHRSLRSPTPLARHARPHPHIVSFIKIGQGGPEL